LFRFLNAFLLPFAPIFVILAGHSRQHIEKHSIYSVQHAPCELITILGLLQGRVTGGQIEGNYP